MATQDYTTKSSIPYSLINSTDSPSHSLNHSLNHSYNSGWEKLGRSYDSSAPVKNESVGLSGTHDIMKRSASPGRTITTSSRNGYTNGDLYSSQR